MAARLRIALFLLAAMGLVQPCEAGPYVTGFQLLSWIRAYEKQEAGKEVDADEAGRLVGFVSGVLDAREAELDIPDTVKLNQLVLLVVRFVKGHPEKWNEPGRDLVLDAIERVFPKK